MSNAINVPLLDLKAQYATLKAELEPVVRSVLEGASYIMGPECGMLEKEIAEYTSSKFAIGCANGSDAILLALMALDIKPGDEIVCPSYTFFATGGSISRLGARPVFVDIDPKTYNMCPKHTREVARQCKRLKAIMPVHLFGQAADMDALLEIGREFNVPVIEDSAQAIGTKDNKGAPVGSRGAIGTFSFFPSKNLGAFGDGGIMTTNDQALNDKLSILRVHGSKPKYYHKLVGVNSRLDTLQAAILRVKLRHLEAWHAGRQKNADFYDSAFKAAGAKLSGVSWKADPSPLRIPFRPAAPARHIYNQYVIRVPADKRDALRDHLKAQNIGTEIYYPVPLHLQECFADLGYRQGSLPESEGAANETLALPIYPELTREQLQHVANCVVSFLGLKAGANVEAKTPALAGAR
ncbi:MAG: DegT/DnrJ/EryC1/StrS family aminotransferase [Phycisphaerales bacterium]